MLTLLHTTKDKLMRAALTLVARDGFGAATTAAIAEEAGYAEGTLYRHFKGKDDLLVDTYRKLKAEFFDAVTDGYDADADPETRFLHLWHGFFDAYRTDLAAFQFALRFGESALTKKEGGVAHEAMHGVIRSLCEDGVKAGVVKDLPFDLMMSLFYAPVQALLKREIAGRRWTDAELDAAARAAWDSWRA